MEQDNQGLAFVDGTYVPIAQAGLPLMDSGFMMGLSVYDALYLHQGYLLKLDAHIDRFYRSLHTVKFNSHYNQNEIKNIVLSTFIKSKLMDANISMIVTRGMRTRGVPIEEWKSRTIVMVYPAFLRLRSGDRERGFRLIFASINLLFM